MMDEVFDRIDTVLMEYGDDESSGVLGVSELDGFLHAIACSPQLIPPSIWLTALWGGEAFVPQWPSLEQAQDFLVDVMMLYNNIVASLDQNECTPVFLEHEVQGRTQVIVDEWCEGFWLGARLWGDGALDSLPDEMLEPILFFLIDPENPLQTYTARQAMADEEFVALQESVPQCVFQIRAHFGL